MNLRMDWSWEADGIAGAEFATVDDAVTTLARHLDRAAAHFGTERQTRVAQACLAPMSAYMCTDGVRALTQGREWTHECGGLRVTLTPVEDPKT
ncbi:hypothetical protein [Streptomyces sp. RPT161]|uniref:hypothetical protein n=1 Tax=Streptomyces sp. RPT161 TaxID=3015993 RepID=UPI0022B8F7EA|nr:hypothetical protein [Streptomyces sp. RPT161]